MCIVKWHLSEQKQLQRQQFELTTVQHSGILLNQWEALSDLIVAACGAQSMRMAMAMAIAMAMILATAIAMEYCVYCAAKSHAFMQYAGNLHCEWWLS